MGSSTSLGEKSTFNHKLKASIPVSGVSPCPRVY